jgi:hypothetical protein
MRPQPLEQPPEDDLVIPTGRRGLTHNKPTAQLLAVQRFFGRQVFVDTEPARHAFLPTTTMPSSSRRRQ